MYVFIHVFVCTYLYACLHTRIRVCICKPVCSHAHMFVHDVHNACIFVHVYWLTRMCMRTRIYLCVSVVYALECMHACMQARIYT